MGLYAFSSGLYTYWTNSLTTYYVTSRRIIKEYRFLSLVRREIPREKVRGVQERKSAIEALVGLGNVLVASGGGRSLEIRMRNMEQSESFADSIRTLISES
ncbi:PH domain-containing protein [Halorussus caseinilyticus]|uniref:PH domain-containing protein n=1 Tax=Halorussus caseinilyticus TaxID=3034025 RepID=A0ABD5WJU2_9EURY